MGCPTLTGGDIFRRDGETYRQAAGRALVTAQRRGLSAIESCRTAARGGHVEPCDGCGHTRVWYNSCRTRQCPSGQSLARAAWIEDRTADLRDVPSLHVVLTVPHAIAAIAAQTQTVGDGILVRATAAPLRTSAADPRQLGAAIGGFAVLHTWGQTLMPPPHLPCVVPGGGACLVSFVDSCSKRYRRPSTPDSSTSLARFSPSPIRRALPRRASPRGRPTGGCLPNGPSPGPNTSWNTSAATRPAARSPTRGSSRWTTAPCASAQHHRAASPQTAQPMTLDAPDFLRRVLLHVLPSGFHRIRYYGWLGHRHRAPTLARGRPRLGTTAVPPIIGDTPPPSDPRDRSEALTGISRRRGPGCGAGHMTGTPSWLRGHLPPARPATS